MKKAHDHDPGIEEGKKLAGSEVISDVQQHPEKKGLLYPGGWAS
jgi:hypothetical protein